MSYWVKCPDLRSLPARQEEVFQEDGSKILTSSTLWIPSVKVQYW